MRFVRACMSTLMVALEVWALLFLILMASSTDAQAAGLVALSPSGADGTGSGPAGTFAALQSLEVTAELDPGGAKLTEHRRYRFESRYVGTTATVTFYRSLVGPPGTSVTAVTVGGQARSGTTLPTAQADTERRRLTLELGDSGPLREHGTSLFVTEPIEITIPSEGTLEVDVTTSAPLAAQGTLSGRTGSCNGLLQGACVSSVP